MLAKWYHPIEQLCRLMAVTGARRWDTLALVAEAVCEDEQPCERFVV